MKIGSCLYEGRPRIIREDNGHLVLLPEDIAGSLKVLLVEERLSEAAAAHGEAVSADSVVMLPPITDPDKILAVGFNYRGHLTETGAPLPEHPSLFVRFPSSQVGHDQPVIAPAISSELDCPSSEHLAQLAA